MVASFRFWVPLRSVKSHNSAFFILYLKTNKTKRLITMIKVEKVSILIVNPHARKSKGIVGMAKWSTMPDLDDLWPSVAGSMAKSDRIYGQIKLQAWPWPWWPCRILRLCCLGLASVFFLSSEQRSAGVVRWYNDSYPLYPQISLDWIIDIFWHLL